MSNGPHSAPIIAPTPVPFPPTTLRDIVAYSFEEGHGFPPHEWQIQYIMRMLHATAMAACDDTLPSSGSLSPFLICRSTGGGKSACRNTMGFVRGGVTLTIVPLLSLGADQTTKLQALRDANDLPIAHTVVPS
jgi:hypothetical protein